MKVSELIRENPLVVKCVGAADTDVRMLTADSRTAQDVTDGLFFCISGANFDGHRFAPQMVKKGCTVLVCEREVPDAGAKAQIVVSDVRAAMALIAAAFYGHPERKLRLIGVTGTKGKTTTTYLLKAILETAGMKCGLIGTTGCMIGSEHLKSELTTPDPIDMFSMLDHMVHEGVQAVCMEVSAHALALRKLTGMSFEAAAYTNLSLDHLDFFGTMEKYRDTKKLLFTSGLARNAAFNLDDESTAEVMRGVTIPHVTYAISEPADLYARDIEITERGVSFELNLRKLHAVQVHLRMTGMFNVYNSLAAAAMAMIMGVELNTIKRGLESIANVPGRIETLETQTPYRVILDYSHSPDALENILRAVRAFTRGRLIVLFGCGGDRDKGKRPVMGRIAGEKADFSILTSDNPRHEDPMEILREIEAGIAPTGGEYITIENRREAIAYALSHGENGDVIVLAGKGHETYQDIAGVKHPFDEKKVVMELLARTDE